MAAGTYTQADTTAYSTFTIMFWTKDSPIEAVRLNGTQVFYIGFDSATSININGVGSVTIDSISGVWSHFAIVKSGSVASVYQNGVLKGTVNIAGTKGGTSVIINNNLDNDLFLYDLRIYNAAISAAAILYYYDDMNDFDGVKTLPTA